MVIKNLEMVKGDTFKFELYLPEETFVNVTGIYFTMKRKGSDSVYLFQERFGHGVEYVAVGTWRIRVAPEDTNDIDAGTYDYDLCVCSDNDVYTILIGKMKLLQDVTEEGA